MKGAVWEFWIFGTVAIIIVIMSFYTFAPFINTLTTTASDQANFDTVTTNTSFNNLLEYNQNMFNLWPIAAIVVVFILFFIAAAEEDELSRGRF